MAKNISKPAKLTRQQKVGFCRWEPLRRNENYIADFKNKIPDWKKVVCYGMHRNKNINKYFQRQYGLYFPINPKLSFFDITKIMKANYLGKKIRREHTDIINAYMGLLSVRWGKTLFSEPKEQNPSIEAVMRCHPLGDDEVFLFNTKKYRFLVKVDLSKPIGSPKRQIIKNGRQYNGDLSKVVLLVDLTLPKPEIMRSIEKEIGVWKYFYSQQVNRNKIRLENYIDYLSVYDFVNKYGVEKAAENFYENDSKQNKHYAIRKVRRDCNRFQELINGGYRQIR